MIYNNDKEEILQATERGYRIFKHFIPGLHSQGKKRNIKAVFRDDGENADASVNYSKEKGYWYYHDFVSGEHLTPFDFVMAWYKCDFKTSLEIINHDILHHISPMPSIPKATPKETPEGKNFSLELSDDYNYWLQFATENRMIETLQKYNVKSLKSYKKTGV